MSSERLIQRVYENLKQNKALEPGLYWGRAGQLLFKIYYWKAGFEVDLEDLEDDLSFLPSPGSCPHEPAYLNALK